MNTLKTRCTNSGTFIISTKDNLTIGDLHGNSIKLIHILIDYGIIDLPSNLSLKEKKQEYQKLINDYHQDIQNYSNNIADYYFASILPFHKLLSKFQFNHTPAFIRLLGDMLADRGRCDIFTLFLLKKMHANKIPFEITLSNHDEQFIATYINSICKNNPYGPYVVYVGPANTLLNLGVFLSKMSKEKSGNAKIAQELLNEIKEITNHIYLPTVKFIAYEFNEATNTFSIFTHAPVGLITIEFLAQELGIIYDDTSVKNLITTIEKINAKFLDLVQSGDLSRIIPKASALYTKKMNESYTTKTMQEIKDQMEKIHEIPINDRSKEQNDFLENNKLVAIYRLIWDRFVNKINKTYDITDMPASKNNINFLFIHGHEMSKNKLPHITNYDNINGKSHTVEEERYFYETISHPNEHQPKINCTIENYIDHGQAKEQLFILANHERNR